MIGTILKIVETGLSLWEQKEGSKVRDRAFKLRDKMTKLKKEYHAELFKPEEDRDNGNMDRIRFELRELGDEFVDTVGVAGLGN